MNAVVAEVVGPVAILSSQTIGIMEHNNERKEAPNDEVLKLPFSHVATKEVLDDLQEFELAIAKHYEGSFGHEGNSDVLTNIGWDQVTIDSVLGEGGFSFVFQVHIQHHDQCFALKCLKAKAVETTEDLIYNAMDLFNEAHILSHVDHPNIIGLHGVSDYSLPDSYRRSDGYFVLLDIMESTLMHKLNYWRTDGKRARKLACTKPNVAKRLQHIAVPVADALLYLQARQIVLRDLKPENIGFSSDGDGTVKLFDFGLARELSTVKHGDVAGSIAYMAPEVMLEEGTYLESDVYSFAMVAWELCTLELPLARFTTLDQVCERVAKGNWRPSLSSIPSKSIRQLIQQCWTRNPLERPSFSDIIESLNQVCGKYYFGSLDENSDNPYDDDHSPLPRRNSLHSFRKIFQKKDQETRRTMVRSVSAHGRNIPLFP